MKDEITIEEFKKINALSSKYRAVKVNINGITFHSKAEAEFYKLLWNYKINHQRQVKYKLMVNNVLITTYYADFVFPEIKINGRELVIDVKGVETREFKIKKKLMKAIYGIDVITIKHSELMSWAIAIKNNKVS